MYEKVHGFSLMDGVMAAGMALMTVGIGYNLKTKFDSREVELIKGTSPTVTQGELKVLFDISGEVLKPGVYKLQKGCRIVEAMAVAGGMSANADREWVEKNMNMAAVVGDGSKIYIPRRITNNQNPTSKQGPITNNQETNQKQEILGVQSGGLININSASLEELDKLTGIGPALGQRIIDYRTKNGGFRDINELKLVSGIGDKLFEKIKEQIGL